MKLFLFFIFILCSHSLLGMEKVFLFESFENLKNWRPIEFPEDELKSQYYTVKIGDNWVLKTESKKSASGILSSNYFNPYEFRNLSWRWKVDSVFFRGDVSSKKTSDLPLAIYVVFQYDPEKASTWESIQYNAMKMIYGEYPPYRAICYAWSSKKMQKSFLFSTFTDRIAIISLQKGNKNTKRWIQENVNFFDDYRFIFHEEPPSLASIGIMNDSDDTQEQATSFVDNLKIFDRDSHE